MSVSVTAEVYDIRAGMHAHHSPADFCISQLLFQAFRLSVKTSVVW